MMRANGFQLKVLIFPHIEVFLLLSFFETIKVPNGTKENLSLLLRPNVLAGRAIINLSTRLPRE